MRNRDRDRAIRRALADCDPSKDSQAEERARVVVAKAYESRLPNANSRRRRGGALLGTIVALAVGAAALSPAGAQVRDWISDAISPEAENVEPRLVKLPSEGSILVESRSGAWVVDADGSRRRLGDYDRASWSPNGLFVAVAKGAQISALTPEGVTRWVRPADSEVTGVEWSTDDGDRVAYLVGGRELHVMAADNSSDSTIDEPVSPVAPAWRPDISEADIRRELTYVVSDGSVRDVDLDTDRNVQRRPGFEVREIEWSADGSMLMMRGQEVIALSDPAGTALRRISSRGRESSSAGRWSEAAMSPTENGVLAAVKRSPGRSRLQLFRSSGVKNLVTVSSGVSDLTWSPDGKWLVMGLPGADQWLFIRPDDGAVRAVSNIARQFESPGAFPGIAGWCC